MYLLFILLNSAHPAMPLQDLTFSYLHMTNRDVLILETFENPLTYLSGELSDEGSYSSYYTCGKF